jgi:biotin transport system substrate-specific component
MALVGLMAALTCILAPMSIPLPFSPVPFSLTPLVVYFSIYVLGMKQGAFSYLIYLLLGLAGLPVFSGFSGGPGKLLGPTGGYLIGMLLMAAVCGCFIDRWPSRMLLCFLGMALGTLVNYTFGTVWLAWQAGMAFPAALMAGVIPYIPGDLAKMLLVMLLGPQVRNRLKKAALI